MIASNHISGLSSSPLLETPSRLRWSFSLAQIHTHTHTHIIGVHFTAHCHHYLPFLPTGIIMETEMSIGWNDSLSSQINLPSLCLPVLLQNTACILEFSWMYVGVFVLFLYSMHEGGFLLLILCEGWIVQKTYFPCWLLGPARWCSVIGWVCGCTAIN